MYLKNHSDEIDSKKLKKYIAGYVVISMLGIFLFLKNISANVEGDLSPFIPYNFIGKKAIGTLYENISSNSHVQCFEINHKSIGFYKISNV